MEREEASDACEYHAGNKLALHAFIALQTQWRVIAGMGGAVYQGLVYASIPVVMDALRVPARQRPALIADLQVMERAALVVCNEKRDSDGG